jgi:hypothetical protein
VSLGRAKFHRVVCHVLAAAMLFAQAVGVAQTCSIAAHSPAVAFAPTDHDGGCGKTVNRNACLQQCTAGDQNTSQIQIAVAEMPTLTVLTVPAAREVSGMLPDAVQILARSPDPPPSIRFCSLQL